MNNRSVKQIRHAVLKNENESHDANVMAALQNQKTLQSNHDKSNRIKHFLDTTKSNASRIHQEVSHKKMEDMNIKKIIAQKQKEVKAKYTVVDKKKDQPKTTGVQPKVDWKKAVNAHKGVSIPNDRVYIESDEEGSGVDSEFQQTGVRSPEELIKERADVRSKMLNKCKQK